AEGKLLLGLLLDGVGAAVAEGGRAAAELRALHLQLLDLQSGPLCTTPPSSIPDRAGKPMGRVPSGSKPTTRHADTHGSGVASAVVGAMRPGSAHQPGLLRTLMSAGADSSGRRVITATVASLPALSREDTFDLEHEGAPHLQWMTSSPELALEEAPGPSQLEVLVSTMRSHLGTTIADVEAASEAIRNAAIQDLSALDLQELIGQGGQGVVFKGLLHGLETAVKLNVCRDGEPLEEDELCSSATEKAAGTACDGDGLMTTAELEELAARLRKAKRGAMEHALTPTLSHPNIVQAYATFSNVVSIKCTYRGDRQPRLRLVARDDAILANLSKPGPLNQVICFEYCDCGTLLDAAHMGAFRRRGASASAAIARPALVPLYMSLLEVALALRYLHARRLVHCDLKPSNVLLKGSNRDVRGWTCKLSDFGCTRLMTEMPQPAQLTAAGSKHSHAPPPTSLGFRMAMPLGTMSYMAPEVFLKDQILTAAVDIYAFGILMYELLLCHVPYNDVPPSDIPHKVVRCHLRPEFHPLSPPDYCSLASRCWSASPSRRPSASDLVTEVESLLKLARKDEAMRPSGQPSVSL
ncbi:hypothetical protein Vretifemale_10252, partial [Volvox reticuliferus]